ncbi:hypothetical protein PGT21_024824 [Puccinia graminis f. sp. tritici]|uniref:Uncharacterized protein n=1 Tax=Puccinia graminis f. sp. tritici TaxID=56615 RepID=A0A5B0MCR2_PUCGR|nr:hypothetical protein PGT21_024824 [Puccinia graminis f. sp. tritici]
MTYPYIVSIALMSGAIGRKNVPFSKKNIHKIEYRRSLKPTSDYGFVLPRRIGDNTGQTLSCTGKVTGQVFY